MLDALAQWENDVASCTAMDMAARRLGPVLARHLRSGRDRIGVPEIARAANLTEAVTHRALRTLQERGWLMAAPAGSKGTTYTALTPVPVAAAAPM
jgi:hypothetical protein